MLFLTLLLPKKLLRCVAATQLILLLGILSSGRMFALDMILVILQVVERSGSHVPRRAGI